MSEDNAVVEDEDVHLSSTQLVLAILFGLLMAYLSYGYTHYTQLPSSRRTITNFLLPFGSTQSAETLHRKGVKHYRSGNYQEALSLFRKSLEIEPSNYKGVFLMGGALIRLDRYRQGLDLLGKVAKAKPDFARTYAKQAYVLLGLGRYGEARRTADQYFNQSEVADKNRVYGILLKLAAHQLSGGNESTSVNELVQTARGLNLKQSSLPLKLVDLLAGERTVNELLDRARTRGEETEIKAWGGVRALVEGRNQEAETLLRWVVSEGDPARYEYDLARALLHADASEGAD